MKQFTVGIFAAREDAEKAINQIHNELKIDSADISYIYRNTEGKLEEVDAGDVSSDTPVEGAGKGALVGGAIGALAGIVAAVGILPALGALFVAGPLAAALGFTGALGTAVAGAATGAAAGGLIGALQNMGIGEEHAKRYADRVEAGNILVATHSEIDPTQVFEANGALETGRYTLAV